MKNANNSTYQSSGTFEGLSDDVYEVYVRDNKGCTNIARVTVVILLN